MAQNEVSIEEEKPESFQLPWINFLSKPQMNFKRLKITLPHKAPHQYILGSLVFFSLFLLAGGVYDLANAPIAVGFTSSGYTPLYPSLNAQFLVESVSALVFIGLGSLGFFLLKYPLDENKGSDIRSASFIQGIGILLIFIGLFATYVMLQMKLYNTI